MEISGNKKTVTDRYGPFSLGNSSVSTCTTPGRQPVNSSLGFLSALKASGTIPGWLVWGQQACVLLCLGQEVGVFLVTLSPFLGQCVILPGSDVFIEKSI